MNILEHIKVFLKQSRAMFLTCTLTPVACGGALAYHDMGKIDLPLFLVTLLGVCIAHLGVNLSNDYFDFKQGADVTKDEANPYSGGSETLTKENISPKKIFISFWTCFIIALLIGIIILFWIEKGRLLVITITVLGFIGGYSYTAPPLRLAYRGLGELDVFIFLGPAPVLGTYAVLTGTLIWKVFICALPLGGLIAAELWINEFTDYLTDKEAGKSNMVVILGPKKARWGFIFIALFVYASVIYSVLIGFIEPTFLLALLTTPIAGRAIKRVLIHYDDPKEMNLAQADYFMVHLFTGLLCVLGAFLGKI